MESDLPAKTKPPAKPGGHRRGERPPGHRPSQVIYDWNLAEAPPRPGQPFDLFDETLRDGLQSPSVTNPSLEDKLEILELMGALGVKAADLGLPGASRRAFQDVVSEASYIRRRKLDIQACCAAR